MIKIKRLTYTLFSILALMISGCDASGGSSNPSASSSGGGSGGSPVQPVDPTQPVKPSTGKYSINYPQSDSATQLKLDIDKDGNVTSVSFPDNITLNVEKIKSQFGDFEYTGVNAENCSGLRNELNSGAYSSSDLINQVEKNPTATVSMSMTMLNNIGDYIKTAVNNKYKTNFKQIKLEDSILEQGSFVVTLKPNAISLLVQKSADQFNAYLDKAITPEFLAGKGALTAVQNITFPVDLMCDFYQGNASLTLSLDGHYKDTSKTILFSNELANVYNTFTKQHSNDYDPSNTTSKNIEQSTLILKGILKDMGKTPNVQDFIQIFEKVVDQNTGKVRSDLESWELINGIYQTSKTGLTVNSNVNVAFGN